jgi:hypothetical protein
MTRLTTPRGADRRVGVYVVRIGLMLREQRIMERAYRLRLATVRGKLGAGGGGDEREVALAGGRARWFAGCGRSFNCGSSRIRVGRESAGISPEMAVRLSIAFGTAAESWLGQQLQFDLAKAEAKRRSLRVRKLAAA